MGNSKHRSTPHSPSDFSCLVIDCSGHDVRCGLITCSGIHFPPAPPAPTARSVSSLIPSFKELYRQTNTDFTSTKLIATTYGPGAFTSLRIGITAAKTLGYCYSIPVVGVNSLDAYAVAAAKSLFNQTHHATDSPSNITIFSSLNAFRNQVFSKAISFTPDAVSERLFSFSGFEERLTEIVDSSETQLNSENLVNQNSDEAEPKLLGEKILQKELATETYSHRHATFLEQQISERFYLDSTTTEIMELEQWKELIQRETSNRHYVSGPSSWRKTLAKRDPDFEETSENLAIDWVIPEEDLFYAIGSLGFENWKVLNPEQRSAMALQPIYFRKSAAEENAAK